VSSWKIRGSFLSYLLQEIQLMFSCV